MVSGKKKEAEIFGKISEELASQEYTKRGYAILERRWRLGKTEIDLIAQKEDIIVIVEVKARSGEDEDALSAVTADKRRRMIRAADSFLKGLKGDYSYRFDIVTVTGSIEAHEIEIFEDAFMATDIF